MAQVWLDASYDPGLRPPPCKPYCRDPASNEPDADPNGPTVVELAIYPVRLGSVDTRLQSLTADYEINIIWNDPRLAYNASCLQHVVHNEFMGPMMPDDHQLPIGKIWVPMLILENLYPDTEDTTGQVRGNAFRITPAGMVWWQFRTTYRIKCPMDFTDMPFDNQECTTRILAGHPRTEVHLISPDSSNAQMMYDNEDTKSAMSSVEWDCVLMYEHQPNTPLARVTVRDNDYMDFVVALRRNAKYHKIYLILPVCIAVIIAWSSFFIARAATPARVAMTIVCYLTLSNTQASILAQLPKVPYNVRFLHFTTISMLFVFFAVFEYAMANWLMRIEGRIEKALKKAAAEATAASTTADATEVRIEGGKRDHDDEKGKPPPKTSWWAAASRGSPRTAGDIRARVNKHLTGVDRFFVSPSGKIRCRDQHLDIACRYLYPVLYTIVLAEFLSHEHYEDPIAPHDTH